MDIIDDIAGCSTAGAMKRAGAMEKGSASANARIADLRRMMVDCQVRTYDVTDRAVLAAMDETPRESFLPGHAAELSYLDRAETITSAEGSRRTLLQPMVLARMLQFLDVEPGERVLDYAGGAGYSAAVLAGMGAEVTSVDPLPGMAALARASLDAAHLGQVRTAPALAADHVGFDCILINGACEVRPDALLARLCPSGRAIGVMGVGRAARVMLYQRSGDAMSGRVVFDAAAPLLDEFRKPAEFVF
jgi:protein-L-isoaspartate(D-aspartate) O-methyltransferase